MNLKRIALSLSALALIGTGGVMFADQVFGYRGDTAQSYREERHKSMITVIENKDYEAWKNLMGDRRRVTEVINKDNFGKFAEMHSLILAGETAEADLIREELGLPKPGEGRIGKGMGYMGRGPVIGK